MMNMDVPLSQPLVLSAASDAQYTELVHVLEELTVLYGNLSELLQKEKSHLILAEVDKLAESNRTKEALLYKIRALDKKRELKALVVGKTLGLTDGEARLFEIAKKMPKMQAEHLRAIHKTLSLQLEHVVEFNSENEQYAQSALRTLNGAMNEIKQVVSVKPTYGKKGQMAGSQESNAGNFVSREV
jgi:hypothetical protein